MVAFTLLSVPSPGMWLLLRRAGLSSLQPGSESLRSGPAVVSPWHGSCSTWLASLWSESLDRQFASATCIYKSFTMTVKCIQSSLFSQVQLSQHVLLLLTGIAQFAFLFGAWTILITSPLFQADRHMFYKCGKGDSTLATLQKGKDITESTDDDRK